MTKKLLGWALAFMLLVTVAFRIWVYPSLEIAAGYNAKVLCSCIFVSGLSQEEAEATDLNYSLLGLSNNTVDHETKTVRSSVWGFHKKVALYREGFGCTMVKAADLRILENQGNRTGKTFYTPDIWPDEQRKGSPEMTAALQRAFDLPGENKKNTRAILVVKNGAIIGEAYGDGIDQNTPLLGWSMAKSVTATLAGILAKDGFWNLDTPMPIDGWQDDERAKIELNDMLHANSGLEWNEEYGSVTNTTLMLYHAYGFGAYAASFEAEYDPGEEFKYSSGTTNIIAAAMRQAFDGDMDYWNFPYRKLFGPIGAKTFTMEIDPSGHFAGSSYTYASARDWAKLGLLYLNNGNWNGRQIIDPTWVEFVRVPAEASEGAYGGHFWLNQGGHFPAYDSTSYWMGGYHGQQVSIHPDRNMVIVRLGVTYDREDFDFSEIIGGIIDVADAEKP